MNVQQPTRRSSAIRQPTIPLYGRDVELGMLRARVDDVFAGRGCLMLVSGEAGIGKTSLVATVAGEARERGALVLSGQCYDLTTTPPYGAWVEALRGYAAEPGLPQLPGTLENAGLLDSLAGQDALFGEMNGFFDTIAQARPLVLVLEDQHWADSDGLEYLRQMARALSGQRILVIVTYRDSELTERFPFFHYLPLLAQEARPEHVSLARLGAEDIDRLAVERFELGNDDRQRLVEYLHYYAGGNPFFTGELLRALEYDRLLVQEDSGWALSDLTHAQMPSLVRQVIYSWVTRLDDEAQQLLQIAAVIGLDVPVTLWREASGVPGEEFGRAVEQATGAQLLQEAGHGPSLRFAHALVREALYDMLILPRRRSWHQRIAELLAEQPNAEPVEVAHHFHQAGDERAAAWLIRAGDGATRANAAFDAVAYYERALELLEQRGADLDDQARLLCRLAEAHRYTEPRQALAYLGRARDVVDVTGDKALSAIILWSRARIRGFLGEATGDDVRQATAAWHDLTAGEREQVFAYGRGAAGNAGPLAQWVAHHGRYNEAIAIGEACLAAQRGSATLLHRNEIGHAQFALGLSYAGLGRFGEATDAFERACQHFRGVRNHFMAAASLKWQIVEVALPCQANDPAVWQRLLAEYELEWAQARGVSTSDGDRSLPPVFQPLLVSGRWDDAWIAANASVETRFLRIDALAALGEIERLRGRYGEAWTRVNQGIPLGPDAETVSPFFVRLLALQRLAADLALDDERPDDALRWIEAHDRLLEWSGRVLDRAAGILLRARYYGLRNESERARELAWQALALAQEPPQPLVLLAAQRFLGELATRDGRFDDAERHLDRALVLADACAASFERALALAVRADLCVSTKRVDDARVAAAEATAICETLGAAPTLARLEAVRERIASEERVSSPHGKLSPRELDVLRLVARGMTDAEVASELFISPRTVAHHLQSIYNKLGTSTRTAAALFAYEHNLV